jgi:hypothetical protein
MIPEEIDRPIENLLSGLSPAPASFLAVARLYRRYSLLV